MRVGVSYNTFLYRRLGLSRKGIRDQGEALRARRCNLREGRRVEPFAVAGTQGDGADQCGIKRLPTDGEFRPLRGVLSACRRLRWEGCTRENGRGGLAVQLIALGR